MNPKLSIKNNKGTLTNQQLWVSYKFIIIIYNTTKNTSHPISCLSANSCLQGVEDMTINCSHRHESTVEACVWAPKILSVGSEKQSTMQFHKLPHLWTGDLLFLNHKPLSYHCTIFSKGSTTSFLGVFSHLFPSFWMFIYCSTCGNYNHLFIV